MPSAIQITPTAVSGSSATDPLSDLSASPAAFTVRVPDATTRWSLPRAPWSAAVTVTSPPANTSESFDVMPSLACAVTDSAPRPAIHRSAVEKSVALGESATVLSTAEPAASARELTDPSARSR